MTSEAPENIPLAGTITAIEPQKKDARRISIFLDQKFAFGAHQDILLQHNLFIGRILDETTVQEIIQADQLIRAKFSAISYISHRARTEHEVRQKLRREQFEEDIIDAVISRLYDISYLDDDTFVENFIRSRLHVKGHGPLRLKADLRRLGISTEKIDQALQTIADPRSLFNTALEQARKRSERLRREKDSYTKRRKLYGFLLRKGHTPDIAREVLDRLEL